MEKFIEPTVDFLIDRLLASDPVAADLNRQYPGLDQALRNSLRPILQDDLDHRYPQYVTMLTELYASRLSTAEIGQVKIFLTGEVGQILLGVWADTLASHAAVTAQYNEPGNDGGPTQAQRSEGAKTALQRMSTRQLNDLKRFFESPAGQKFQASDLEKKAIEEKWIVDSASPDLVERVDRAMTAAAEAHIASAGADGSLTQ
ncbi:hypothetical protein L7H23_15270 [Sphingopyxis sp. BSN-002]|uniref:hypothetical protein n=1 Tax=Sphingopyxis sp. BSN-002 TaxID=2911495 RepID=UPI001EDADB5D|nr:hypothetical protein [Sphingopyxis sp. BSN-002]UKK83916.1 hypothetical protein L7H23_15270 [Sphingopyxis sp. BSN-002]